MRKLIAAGVLVIALIFFLTALWLLNGAKSCLEPGILNSQMDKVVKLWADSSTDQSSRVVDMVISDSLTGAEPQVKKESAEGEVSDPDADILPAANKPAFFQLIQRTFFRKSVSAEADTDLIKAFTNRPNTITWTHKGRESVSEDEMTREITRAILKADEAGAEINIVTQGFAAAPALRAIDALKTVNISGRVPAVNKLIALDMNRPTLKRINPGFFGKFKRPENLKEWVNVWHNPAAVKFVIAELHNSKFDGKKFSGGEIFIPFIIRRGISDEDILNLVKNFVQRGFSLEQVLDYLVEYVKGKVTEEEAREKLNQAQAEARDRKDSSYKRKFAMQTIDQPIDPLEAIMGTAKKNANEQEKAGENLEIKSMTWDEGVSYCKQKKQKLPGLKELKGIWKKECSSGENPELCNGWFWSSQETRNGTAWYVAFASGRVGSYRKDTSHFVWCVP